MSETGIIKVRKKKCDSSEKAAEIQHILSANQNSHLPPLDDLVRFYKETCVADRSHTVRCQIRKIIHKTGKTEMKQ